MSWRAVIAALDEGDAFRSRVSLYLHPLAGRPVIWHVIRALLETSPPPDHLLVLHREDVPLEVPNDPHAEVEERGVPASEQGRTLRAAITAPGMAVLVDGAAPLLTPQTIARLLRAAESGVSALDPAPGDSSPVAVAGEGLALASADDPRRPQGTMRVSSTTTDELLRVVDRHGLARAAVAMRDRLVRLHESQGVTFLLPDSNWLEVDVRIGSDTVIYPGVVIEGVSAIQDECVIGPYSRILESTIGRGVELKGWNYIARTSVRNHAVLEPYVRRGYD